MKALSVCIITQNERFDPRPFLANVGPVADEILVVDGGAKDGRRAALEAHPAVRIVDRPFDNFTAQKNFAFSQAKGDWILMLDTDELLGDRLRDAVRGLMTARCRDYWKILRIWLVALAPPRYVQTSYFESDWEIRLFRNTERFRYPVKTGPVHHVFDKETRGRGKKYRGGAILHLDFVFNDRKAREAKIARYAAMDPVTHATGINRGYLWEDVEHEILPLEEPCAALEAVVV